jgi:hypothetical protein
MPARIIGANLKKGNKLKTASVPFMKSSLPKMNGLVEYSRPEIIISMMFVRGPIAAIFALS